MEGVRRILPVYLLKCMGVNDIMMSALTGNRSIDVSVEKKLERGFNMEHNKKERSSFSGGIGFVLAAAGSAVGLGNLWRFPYLAAQYGGGIFILVYIILALTFGFTLMTTEIAIGRKTKQSPGTAYKAINKKFGFLGVLAPIVPVIILPYYCVIGGWGV